MRLRHALIGVMVLLLTCSLSRAHQPDNAAGVFYLDWINPQVERTTAVGVFQTLGLRIDNDPSRAHVTLEQGHSIVHGIALAFGVEDAFAFDIDETVTAEIEIKVDNLRELYYAWDKNGTVSSLRRFEIPPDLTGWQTFSFELDRARFANRGFHATDFAIASGIDMSSTMMSIRSLRFVRHTASATPTPNALLELTVSEAQSGDLLAAQVGLFDATGRMPLPGDMATEFQFFDTMVRHVEVREELDHPSWPHSNHHSMYVDGFYRAHVPAGDYDLVVVRGPEYPIVQRRISLAAGKSNKVEVELRHALDMPARGWYSGDVHNHLTRESSAANANQMAHARAQDLHMHWLYALGNSVTTHFPQYAWGEEGHYREQDYFLGSGQEDPRTDYLGHMLSMGQDEMVRFPERYLSYKEVAREVQAQGGVVGVAHMDFAQFQQKVALAMLAPEGLIDFVEVMQYHSLNVRDWYAFLNMGFELPAAAGSDWPYMSLPGSVRTYVEVEGQFDPKSWNEGLDSGRSFVSNGPVLDLEVNSEGMGSRIEIDRGEALRVEARALIEPSWDLLSRLDLIVNGEVVESITDPDGAEQLVLNHELAAAHGMWIAVRCQGLKSQDIVFQSPYTKRIQAHSSPVYVHVDGEPSWDRQKGVAAIEALIERLEAFKEMPYQRNDNEAWESPDRTQELVGLFHDQIRSEVDLAIQFYEARARQIAGENR